MEKTKVAFICMHHSCTSQIAEALGEKFAGDVFDSYLAGTTRTLLPNPEAVRLMKELYDIDLDENENSKLLKDLPPVDIVVKMDSDDIYPSLPGDFTIDLRLEDPDGKSQDEFRRFIFKIEQFIKNLAEEIKKNHVSAILQ
ncbi:arsenate reductase ArsC [Acetobacterium fimetarium]|uniref:Arsenate reductase ArsC n=1 Tax=Acetobacterium fimetarium TaxID=52691 RepID=A0ABR6WRF3_9FIRM|nr:arsenate reductase ArsC [Acetobacterium fimetarium]MBC3802945.1 arsenate reductase ArsC [Acetobacterium fimetarium]